MGRQKLLRQLIAFLVFFMTLYLVVHYVYTKTTQKTAFQIPRTAEAIQKERIFLDEQIQTLGPDAAYQNLLILTTSSTEFDKHLMGHIFGHELYMQKGLGGFPACDKQLGGGCLHEFVGVAIQREGLSIVSTLNQNCLAHFGEKESVACQHGLGHGLLSFFGYEMKDLTRALASCKLLATSDPIHGCYSGALMEFDTRTMTNNVVRSANPKAPFELCDQLTATYKPACYFWTPARLWQSLYNAEKTAEAFAGVGAYCEKAPALYTDYCFQGLGNFIPVNASFDKQKAQQLCDATSNKQHYRDSCWKEASATM